MEISYDKDADAMYIRFRRGTLGRTRKIDDLTMIDLDDRGNILGIELLDASKRIPKKSLSEVHVKNLEVAP
ncbi:DUF2283 domain-containing protein [Candidatus Woesearchaeota archaeon]|nr:DUF2283 domain-containing protein [Candidatus Woesearchaeota archaeon]